MTARFVAVMAARESRASLTRLRLLLASVAVGVAVVVAIGSFSAVLRDSIRSQARALLGADLALGSASPFTPRAEAELEEIRRQAPGAVVARVTRFGAMARAETGTAAPRLVQVVAADRGYPFYGQVATVPPGAWDRLAASDAALVDDALSRMLGAREGDTLVIGEARLPIGGVVTEFPGDVGLRAALGPRVFLSPRHVAATGLLGPGARVRHEAYVSLPASASPDRMALRHRPALAAERVSLRTVADDQAGAESSLGRIGSYLGLVGLLALMLGGLGVASATHSLIRRKLDGIALLRCLGASGNEVLAIELLQALALGVIGSVAGAALGVLVQAALPRLFAGLLPVQVAFALHWPSVAFGIAIGAWTTAVFSLLPLLRVRHVAPLHLLRRATAAVRLRLDVPRAAALAALCASVLALCVLQARGVAEGVFFAAAMALVMGLLWLAAVGLRAALRRGLGARLSYPWRQGFSNLYRPANQTAAVVVAVGFGGFLLMTLLLVEHNLLRDLHTEGDRPNLALFDVQPDQRAAVEAELRRAGVSAEPFVPIVPMRIAAVNGVPVQQLLGVSASRSRGSAPHGWALRREYRSTYRDEILPAETVTAGRPWAPGSWRGRPAAGGILPISVETGLASELGVKLGDEITWDVQGLEVRTRLDVLREVQWARFEPNFFVVFPAGPLDAAPATLVTLARVDDPARRAALQVAVLAAHPNVSVVDLTQLQQAVESLAERLTRIVRLTALSSLAAGILVLLASLAGSRYERLREAALLKAMGATRAQLLRISIAEHFGLGAVAASAALLLSLPAAWALVRYVFEARFAVPGAPLLALAVVVAVLAVAAGVATAAEVARRSPLAVLRAE